MTHKQTAIFIAFVCGLSLGTLLLQLVKTTPVRAAVGINRQVNFQGKLVNTNGTNIPNGAYNIRFRVYDAATLGAVVWTEDRVYGSGAPDNRVTVTDGIFQVNLGSVCTLAGGVCGANTNSAVDFNSDNIFLTIDLGDTSLAATFALASGNGEMSPRIQYTAAPYAFNTDQLDGLDKTGFVQLAQGVQTDASTTNPSIFLNKTNVSGTPNILELQKNGVDVFSVGNTGALTLQNSANSNAALNLKNAGGGSVLRVDTAATNTSNLLANASFEASFTGNWLLKGGATLTQDVNSTQNPPYGTTAAKVASTGVAGDGVKQNITLTTSANYSISFYARLDTASAAMTTLTAGYNNGTADGDCTMSTTTVTSNGWTKYICSLTTPATSSGTPFFYIRDTGTSHTWYVDAVTLETEATATGNYREGELYVNATVASPLILQNDSNSSTAFQVQNSNGASVFTVDTTDANLIPNPGFELNTTGWAKKGAVAATILRDPSQAKFGLSSLKITTTAAANDGAQFTLPSTLTIGQSYTIGFSAKLSATAFGAGTLVAGYVNGGGDNNCTLALAPAVTATVPSTTGWTRFTCTMTIAATAGTAIYIKQTDAVARSFWIDSVELDQGTTVNPYGMGSVLFNGVVASPVTFQNKADSTQAVLVQNAGATATLLQIDTTNSLVYIGNPNGDASAVLLVLDNKTAAGDPATGSNGGMYYNAGTHQYRCYRDSNWEPCGINPIDRGFVVEDDFFGGGTAAGTIGTAGWVPNAITTACTVTYGNATPAPTVNTPGILRCATAATLNTGTAFTLGTATGGSSVLNTGMVIKASGAVGSIAATTNTLRVGAYALLTIAQTTTSGVWWEADPSTNTACTGNTVTCWRYCFATGAAATCANSTVAVTANTLARLEIRITALGAGTSAADFFINGTKFSVSGVTINTATRVNPAFTCYTQVAAAQNCFMDYYQIRGTATAAR